MPWDSSANIIKKKKTKADFKNGLVKSINIFSKDKKSKSDNMVVDNIQIFKKNPRRKGYLSIERIIIKYGKIELFHK